jgi:hypothetical protein
MLAKVISSAVFGIDAYVVEVEVDIAQGLPTFATVGLPEGAVKESKDRVKAAVKNCGILLISHQPMSRRKGQPSIFPWPLASWRQPK